MSELARAAVNPNEPQIVCFDADICAIEVHGKWYLINGVIDMEQTVPEEYKLNDLLSTHPTIDPDDYNSIKQKQ